MKLLIVPAAMLLAGALTAPAIAKDIDGTDRGETLKGTANADTIRGLGGGDRIEGRAGDDTLLGGPDGDTLLGGQGRDDLQPGPGFDSVNAGKGNDVVRIRHDNASDPVLCGPGRDTVYVDGRDAGDVFIDCENVVFQ